MKASVQYASPKTETHWALCRPESEEEELAMVINSYKLTFTARFEVAEQSERCA